MKHRRWTGTNVDLDGGTVTVTSSKSYTCRELPLHATTVAALAGYARLRDQLSPALARWPGANPSNKYDSSGAAHCLREVGTTGERHGRRGPR